jgi:succinate dehydrogenase / fumarate reductase cytochrome b subunit
MSTPAASSSKSRPEFRNIHVTQLFGYRLPLPGIVSIMHRISGALLFLALPAVLWLFELSLLSEISYAKLTALASHWLVKLALMGVAWAFLHHLVAGLRYLLLDLDIGVDKQPARRSAALVYAISLPLTLLAALAIFGAF